MWIDATDHAAADAAVLALLTMDRSAYEHRVRQTASKAAREHFAPVEDDEKDDGAALPDDDDAQRRRGSDAAAMRRYVPTLARFRMAAAVDTAVARIEACLRTAQHTPSAAAAV